MNCVLDNYKGRERVERNRAANMKPSKPHNSCVFFYDCGKNYWSVLHEKSSVEKRMRYYVYFSFDRNDPGLFVGSADTFNEAMKLVVKF